MLLIEVLLYVIIGVVVMRYVFKQSWHNSIFIGIMVYSIWFFVIIALCI